jgi:hypothetical protein
VTSLFKGFVNAAGKLTFGVAPITNYFRGLPLNAAGAIVVGAGPIVRYEQGMPFNAAGAVVGLSATTATRHGPGATAYGPNGELEGNSVNAVSVIHQGVPYTAGGVYATDGGGGAGTIVSKDFTMTPGVISASSTGYRTGPAVGTIAPDNVYAGGSFDLIQAVNDDTFRVETVGDVQFPGISGNLTLQLPAFIGPNRIILNWDVNLYEAFVPGIYTYLTANIGIPLAMRLSAAPP